MTPEPLLREPVLQDAARLAELNQELGYPSTGEQVVGRLKGVLGHEDHFIRVAVDGSGTLLGWIHGLVSPRLESDAFAELAGLVVTEAARGQGLGGRLLAAAEEWAGSRGLSRIRVRSNVVRQRAHGFYLRAGYAQAKTQAVFDKSLRSEKR